ncbi:MAG: DUF1392 family protein [Nostoc sp.]|uniref:DUF1392 family protein n=1 Tax=Nostoc sp. TaxID=1180 RepID=UPI002FF9C6F6
MSLLERAYVKSAKAFGYCTGVEWSERGWKYEIFTLYNNITVLVHELISTGNLQPNTKEKPVFRLGELVEFRLSLDAPPIQIIQGIFKLRRQELRLYSFINPNINCCFYL